MKHTVKIFTLLTGLALLYTSCRYHEIANAEYPDQIIYMPASYNGIYTIGDSVDTYEVPTPGSPVSYSIDSADGSLLIPLGVYRSGRSLKGRIAVGVLINNDTVNQLIDSGVLADTIVLLPNQEFSFPTKINIDNGKDHVTFELKVNLSFLKQNIDKKFALGVEISSTDRKVNPDLKTTVILLDPKVIN